MAAASGVWVDLRLYLPAMFAWAGALVGLELPPQIAQRLGAGLSVGWAILGGLALSFAAGAAVVAANHPRSGRRLAVVVLVCLLAGLACGSGRVISVQAGPVPGLAAREATVQAVGVVLTDPQRRLAQPGSRSGMAYTVVRVRLQSITARAQVTSVRTPVVVLGDDHWLGLLPGQLVSLEGRLAPADRGGPVAALLRARGAPRVRSAPGLAYRLAEPLRNGLRRAMADRPAAPGGLVPALVIGDETGVVDTLREDFRDTGLAHLTAVSGANVAIIVAAVLGLARWTGVRAYGLPAVGIAAVVGFVVLARPQPSVVRAAAMGLVAVAGLAAGTRRRGVAALGTAVLTLLLLDPWLARSAGFTLSVLATAGILLLAPAWRDAAARWLPRPLAEGLAVPLAAQVATMPVLVALTQSVSLAGLPANILAAPAVAPATILGAATAVVAPLTPALGDLLGRLAVLPAAWIVTVAGHAARFPGATAAWPGGPLGVVLATGVVTVIISTATIVLRHRSAALGFGLISMILILRPIHPGWPPSDWLLVACDVGQGDALVLRTGDDAAVVVDVGPDPRAVDRCLRELDIKVVPEVLLTHFHADHVEGLPGALRGRTVGEIVVSPLAEPGTEVEQVRRWATAAGVPMITAAAGEQRRIGEVSWEVVWPRRLILGEGSDPNNASLVLLADTHGLRVLLSGDVEPAAQQAIRRAETDLRVDVLKVPHHGSAYQDPGFLEAARPAIALISVGADNSYGHPAAATIDALIKDGAMVLRTDTDGAIAVVQNEAGVGVVHRR